LVLERPYLLSSVFVSSLNGVCASCAVLRAGEDSPNPSRIPDQFTPLEPGDLFLLMTDGITESVQWYDSLPWVDRVVGWTRSLDYLQHNRCKPAWQMVSGLFQQVHQYIRQSSHDDNMTVKIIRPLSWTV
jgi:serine/threonine protein phosphatase PrpC